MNKIKKGIIPVAGKGSRLLPITKTLSKSMFPLINKPVIHYLIEEAICAGIEEIILIVGPNQKDIKDYLDMNSDYILSFDHFSQELNDLINLLKKIKITYIIQSEPLGLFDAICAAKDYLKNEDFAVMLGDDFIFHQNFDKYGIGTLCDLYKNNQTYYLGIQEVPLEDTNKYGIVIPTYEKSNLFKIGGIIEKPKNNPPSNLAIIGRYILKSSIFSLHNQINPGINGEIQLSDALSAIIDNEDIYASTINGQRFDIGDKKGYVNAIIALSKTL